METDPEHELAEVWKLLDEWRDQNPEDNDGPNDRKWGDACAAMENLRALLGLPSTVEKENGE